MNWWAQQCPKRGAGLTHGHSNRCDPEGVHPHDSSGNEGNHHPANMCCDCQMTQAMSEAATEAVAARTAPRPVEEHEYQFTITGRCLRCQRAEDAHIKLEHIPGKCPVKHSSITQTSLSIGDEGLQWKKCPGCASYIEPRMSLGGPQGRADGIGRGWVSPRMRRRWENIAREMRPS